MKTIRKTLHRVYDILASFNLRNNTVLKLVSLAIAFTLWILVMDQVNPEITRTLENVRVEFMHQSEAVNRGFVFHDLETYSVDVTVKGRRNQVLNVSQQDIRVTADLDNVQSKGKNSLLLDRTITAQDVMIDSLDKTYVTLTVDRQGKRARDIEVELMGELPTNFVRGDLKVGNDWVYVSGPENLLNTVEKIVGKLDLTDQKALITKDIPIEAVDSEGNPVAGVTLEFDQVNVELPIFKQKVVPVITETVGEVKTGSKIVSTKQSINSIKIQGRQDTIDAINVIYTEKVNIDDRDVTFVAKPLIILPNGVVSLFGSNAISYTVNIDELVTKEYFLAIKDLAVLDLSSDLQLALAHSEEVISVKLTDIQMMLSDISISDLEVYFDGAGITEPGNYQLLVNVRLNNSKTVDKIELTPNQVDVKVSLKVQPDNGEDSQEEVPTGENP